MPGDATLLNMEGISKTFPGVRALDSVDFKLSPGEIVGLVGENGAGKSTLMKIVSGVYLPDSGGRLTFKGEEATLLSPRQAQDVGISTIYQELNLTLNQRVYQNIFLGRVVHRGGILGWFGMVEDRLMKQKAGELLSRIGADIPVDAMVGALTVAQQQEVEIAKALSTQAELIIMDEPTSALSSDEVEALLETMNGLRRQGVAIVFISHRLEEVLRIADRIVVLRDGKKVADLSRAEATMQEVIRLMVGRPLTDFFPKEEAQIGKVALEAKGLSRGEAVKDVSFQLHSGEILGFAGLVGAGRTETARLLFGADHKTAGEILIDNRAVDIRTPLDAVKLGIGFVPEDRKLQGLVLGLPVRENVALAGLRNFSSWTVINLARIKALVGSLITQLRIQTPSSAQKVTSLSGGNQQKVVLSKWLALRPKVLILDEPTRGIDVGAKAEIHAIMSRLAGQGLAIIMISSEMPEILGMSDRIVVMSEGRMTGILDRAEATQEKIMGLATPGRAA